MNAIVREFEAKLETIQAWRHHMHQHPELSFEEVNTSKYIADLVRSWGYEVVEGIGKHGVVASMTVGDGTKSIGLRADTDALPIQEDNNLPYKSEVAGVSHLCGHDGHSTMLLAAGEYLARTRHFNGTVRLIFQPAEEIMAGGPAMIEDGLFERWPVDAVFGMHNMPGLERGKLHFRDGAMMAAVDNWEIELTGKGSHGSMPELSIDPVVAGSSLVMALQTIVSRNVSPHNSAVVTVGAFISGNAGNVIAQSAILRLSIRTTTPEDRKLVLGKVRSITKTQAESFGCTHEIREGVPGAVLVNDPGETAKAAAIAREAFGDNAVMYPGPSYLGSEDFAFMLQKKKGTYCLLGNGDTAMVHHPQYVFDDAILPMGAAYWVTLTERYLGRTITRIRRYFSPSSFLSQPPRRNGPAALVDAAANRRLTPVPTLIPQLSVAAQPRRCAIPTPSIPLSMTWPNGKIARVDRVLCGVDFAAGGDGSLSMPWLSPPARALKTECPGKFSSA